MEVPIGYNFFTLLNLLTVSTQSENCEPQVEKPKFWVEIGGRFEVNCTLIDCDSKFETPVWKKNGKRVRNYRSNMVFFLNRKRVKLIVEPVEDTDKGEYSCHTQLLDNFQTVQLLIGVEPTTAAPPDAKTTAIVTRTTTTPVTTSTAPSSTPTSSKVSNGISISSASTTLKVTMTAIKIIETTRLPLEFINQTTSTSTSATNNASSSTRQFSNNVQLIAISLLFLLYIIQILFIQ